MEQLGELKRTSYCGQLRAENAGQSHTLMGWVDAVRDIGNIVFIRLRDISGTVQITFNDDFEGLARAKSLRHEFVIAVTGNVSARCTQNINPDMATGEIEVIADSLKILSAAKTPPFEVVSDTKVGEELRLKYRYLDLRRAPMQQNLILRGKIAQATRGFLTDNGFLEIETPMLTKSTPEGARDYLVPSRVQNGKFYALPQSPQIFKQLLMVSGMDRYFQIAKCFRDEDLRADRQPEFTQIDMELSFVAEQDVIELNERLLAHIMRQVMGEEITLPMPRLTYAEAMSRYGSDKPDTRFEMELCDISDLVKSCGFKVFSDAVCSGGSVRAICAKGGASLPRKGIDSLTEYVKTYGATGLAYISLKEEGISSPIAKFLSEDEISAIISKTNAKTGDIIFFAAGENKTVFNVLGNLRLEVARRQGMIPDGKYNFLWVTEFPLLEYDEEEKRCTAMHHPFTSPMDEDVGFLESNPLKVRAKAYDIVLNGNEIGGGSIRIHTAELQQRMFSALGFSKEAAWDRFGFMMEAFSYGTPPHGGLAYGLDRLAMLLAGASSIRDVIAFPKVQNASCLMTAAPDVVEEKQLNELGIAVKQLTIDG